MTEQKGPIQKRAEVIQQEFHRYLASVEFGSPDYLAFCDFYALDERENLREAHMNNFAKELDPVKRLWWESHLRITETRIAMLENDIDHRKATEAGYSKAYDRVEETMEELRSAIREETKGHESWIDQYVEETYHDILVNDFRDLLYRFTE